LDTAARGGIRLKSSTHGTGTWLRSIKLIK
jgi:hypothetical protein